MKYTLITGASKGIGKAIAWELAARKHHLILVARSEALLAALAAEISQAKAVQVTYVALDLVADDAAQKLLEFCKQNKYEINGLVNNAGFGYGGKFEENSEADYSKMLHLNINTLTLLSHAMVPMLTANSPAYILNVASTASYQAVPNMAVYAASKAYVLSFSRALAQELKSKNISVTALCPGGTHTDFTEVARLKDKARKAGEKLNMSAEEVAKIGVDAMFSGKVEIVPGFLNKLGVFGAWLLPKSLIEKIAGSIYE